MFVGGSPGDAAELAHKHEIKALEEYVGCPKSTLTSYDTTSTNLMDEQSSTLGADDGERDINWEYFPFALLSYAKIKRSRQLHGYNHQRGFLTCSVLNSLPPIMTIANCGH